MPYTVAPQRKKQKSSSLNELLEPLNRILAAMPMVKARGYRPLQMNFEQQIKALIFYHLEEHQSARHLLQVLEEDEFAKKEIAPPAGIKKSSFSEAINSRGLEQLLYVFQSIQANATKILPKEFSHLGDLISIDGSLIDSVLSMHWADYRKGSKKAKVHIGFDINHSIPANIFLTDGKADERPFVSQILLKGQTGIMDRYYQCHKNFDSWQEEGKHFVCRIKTKTIKTVVEINSVKSDSDIFYDAITLLGTSNVNQTQKQVRVVGYYADGKKYFVATDRFDLTAEDIAYIYKLRWNIEVFFGWWKRHLNVYHLIARTKYGLMVQIMSGLITYPVIAIYLYIVITTLKKKYRLRESDNW